MRAGVITVKPSIPPLGFFMPTYSFEADTVQAIEMVRGIVGRNGIRFRFDTPVIATHRWGCGLLWPQETG
jgi:hypothetical protein